MLTQEQFNNERDFCAMIALASAMLGQGVIDEQDFAVLQRRLSEQYRPVVSRLRAGNSDVRQTPQDSPENQAKNSPSPPRKNAGLPVRSER
jgi:hypothetical protein